MKTEDEIFLSAYLDNELDPDQRSRVESAMLANPTLAERYRQLASVRDLVSSLPRPAVPGDLSATIVAALSPGVPATPWSRLRHGPLGRVGMVAAATLLFTFGLSLVSRDRPHARHQPVGPRPHVTVVSTPEPTVPSQSDRQDAPKPSVLTAPSRAKNRVTGPVGTTAFQSHEAARKVDREQQRIRELLDSPNLNHVFIVVDEIGEATPDRVEELVRRTPRIDPLFGKITVSQGIVIDPKHPNEATVFALVMDQDELNDFGQRLKLDFPSKVEEIAPDPSVVTQLSGIGQVAVFSGTRATELAATPIREIPKAAIRAPVLSKKDQLVVQRSPEFDGMPVRVVDRRPPPSADQLPGDQVSPEASSSPVQDPERPGPTAVVGTSPLVSPDSSVKATETDGANSNSRQRPTSTVLVWVTRRDSSLKDPRRH